MQPKLKRSELDGLAEFYSLTPTKVETLLELADARPSRAEGLRFLGTCLRIAGVLSLAAGLVFFVAANWSEIAVFGRFALIELVLVACAVRRLREAAADILSAAAPSSSPSSPPARLLALFGQTYQTGADVYELFLTWALLGLPLAVAAQWSVRIGRLGAGAQRRAAAVLRLASDGRNVLGCLRQRALSARAI